MRETLQITLPQYVRSITWILNEYEFAANNYDIATYFDAAEITGALLGAEALVNSSGDCDIPRFEEPEMLVRMLLSAGWIGPVRLLPPHQSELLSLITFDFPKKTAGTFQSAVKCLRKAVAARATAEPESDLVGSARQTAEKATLDFKLSEACRQPWPRRLSGWKSKGILDLETIVPNYSKIIDTPEFTKIEQALGLQRPEMQRNNLSDAAAVMTAVYALDRVREGSDRHIPLLYLPRGFLRQAVTNSEIQRRLSVKLDDGRTMPVLRDWAYFVVRATMRPATTAFGNPPTTQIKELRELRNQLRTIDTTRQRISDILVTLNIGDNEVTQRVDTLFDLCFYKNVWLPYEKAAIPDQAIEAVSEDEQKNVDQALAQVLDILKQNVAEYTRLGDLWQRVRDAAKTVREHLRTRGVEFVRAYGGFRFAPPRDVTESAEQLIDALVFGSASSGGDTAVPQAVDSSGISKLILHYEKARSLGPSEIGMLAITLWCLQLDEELTSAIPASISADWLSVLRAAAELRKRSKSSYVADIIARLKRVADSIPAPGADPGRIAIAIGYLSFHTALLHGYQPFWLKAAEHRAVPSVPPALVTDATTYARKAVAQTKDPILHTYAVNQSLYYLVASGTGTRAEMRDLCDQLLRFKAEANGTTWDYRYDDTIARYFMWASLTVGERRLKLEHADSAKQHIDQAFEHGHGDDEVSLFRSILEIYRDELVTGGQPQHPPPPAPSY